MALNPQKRKLRLNGEVVETTEESVSGLAAKAGQPAPVTPAGATNLGANPDQAKMMGAGPSKGAAPKTVSLNPNDTLQGQQRRDQPRQQQSTTESQAAQKAGRLQSLSGLDTRVQALVGQQLASVNAAATANVRYNDAAFTALPTTTDQAGVKALLGQYQSLNAQLQDPNADKTAVGGQINQILADLKNNHNISDPQNYLNLAQSGVGATAAGAILNPTDVTLDKLDLAELGFAPGELDTLVGPGWQSMSVGQFTQRIEDLRQSEYQRINGLRAQLATLPAGSAQRELIQRELGDLAQVGVTGTEQGVRELANTISTADMVTFAGQRMSVDKLLADETISRQVEAYLNPNGDPAAKAALEAQHPEFAEWIKKNSEALTALITQTGASNTAFEEVQTQRKAQATVAKDVTLNDEVMKILDPTWGQAVGAVSQIAGPLYQVLTAPGTPDADRSAIAAKLNAEPELAAKLAQLPPDRILSAHRMAENLMADAALADLVGSDGGDGFLLDEGARKKYGQFVSLVNKVRGNKLGTLLEDPAFLDLIRDGELNQTNMQAFVKNPKAWDEYKTYSTTMNSFRDAADSGSIDTMLSFIFGDGANQSTVNTVYQGLKEAAEYNPNSPEARRYNQLRDNIDTNKDGKINHKDFKELVSTIDISMRGQDLDDILAGRNKKKTSGSLLASIRKADAKTPVGNDTLVQAVKSALTDKSSPNKITLAEFNAMPSADQSKLMAQSQEWKDKYGVGDYTTQNKNVAIVKAARDAGTAAATTTKALGLDISSSSRGVGAALEVNLRKSTGDTAATGMHLGNAARATGVTSSADVDTKLSAAQTALDQLKAAAGANPTAKKELAGQIADLEGFVFGLSSVQWAFNNGYTMQGDGSMKRSPGASAAPKMTAKLKSKNGASI